MKEVPPVTWIPVALAGLAATLFATTGVAGLLYAVVFVLAVAPGLRLGRRLAGPDHAAGWIIGGVIGYGATQIALWIPIFLHVPSTPAFGAAWVAEALVLEGIARRVGAPVLPLPSWSRADARALGLMLLLVIAVMGPPYRNVGAADETGTRYYRAYFTADFVWHAALAAELGRYETPPRNPYMASRPVHYYWTYFLLPSVVAHQAPGPLGDVERALKANALLAAALLVGMLFLLVRAAVPSAGIAALAVALGIVAASAEGTFVLLQLWRRGAPLAAVTEMNIDAITAWQFGGLRVDNIPRSLWYTPQHAFSCALGLVATLAASTCGARGTSPAIWLAGVALGLSTCLNPLLGGVFSLIYGAGVTIDALGRPAPVRTLLLHAVAAIPVLLALGWGAINQVADGAGAALSFGFQGFARRNTLTCLMLSTGPMLLPAVAGLWPRRALPAQPARVAFTGVALALLLMHFVTLSDASWIGFRAGQILLLMLPVLLARALWGLRARSGWMAAAVVMAMLLGGLPTTVIDTYNAQDIGNRRQGPGFRWTLAVTPAQQEAFAWVRQHVPENNTLQMEPVLRGRGHWSLIPTFAQRRMTAGLPISLLPTAEYQEGSAEVQRLFATADARQAWQLARGRGIHYLYVDADDRAAYGDGAAKFAQSPYFEPVLDNGAVAIYRVR